MKPRISMITLGVSDFARSVQFYEGGLKLPRRPMAADADIAFFTLDGTWLALYPRDKLADDATVPAVGQGFKGFTLAHLLASKTEVDAVIAEAIAAGATPVKPAQEVFWGGYSGYVSDPDGYLWEIAFNPHFWIGPKDE